MTAPETTSAYAEQSSVRSQHFAAHSSPVPPLPSFVFTLAATGTTFVDLHVLLLRIQRIADGVKFLGGLENRLRAESGPGLVAGENRAWSSAMISSAAASGIRLPWIGTTHAIRRHKPFFLRGDSHWPFPASNSPLRLGRNMGHVIFCMG